MGCTSSAPNMAPSLAYSEKDLKSLEEAENTETMVVENDEEEKERQPNGIQVLPTCDTLGDSKNLDRNIKPLQDIKSLDDVKVSHKNGLISENDNDIENIDTELNSKQSEEKLSTLEEVVEKVVELYVENTHTSEIMQTETKTTNKDTNASVKGEKMDKGDDKQHDVKQDNEGEDVGMEEASSPSQSQSSRATRWEALADIAAELPPSLAVDPITGQIYSLSK